MDRVDWAKAPAGTIGHARVGAHRREVWFGDGWYEYVATDSRHAFGGEGRPESCWRKEDLQGITCAPICAIEQDDSDIVDASLPGDDPVVVWDGQGLPPVGTVCEYLEIGYAEHTKVKVYANFTDDRGVKLAAFVEPLGSVSGVAVAKCFRPILTPEQIAAEERAESVDALCGQIVRHYGNPKLSEHHLGLANHLHDAGYRKVIDGDRDTVIAAMLDACPYQGSRESVARLYCEALCDAGYRLVKGGAQ